MLFSPDAAPRPTHFSECQPLGGWSQTGNPPSHSGTQMSRTYPESQPQPDTHCLHFHQEPHSPDIRVSSAHSHLTPSDPQTWYLALQPTPALLGGSLAHTTPLSLGSAVPLRPSSTPPGSFSARVAPRAPCRTRGSPLPHPAITVPMRYSSNRQKVLRFCGAMVSPGVPLSLPCRCVG